MAGAPVLAYAPGDGFFPTGLTLSDSGGSFHLHGLPPGEYVVAASRAGGSGPAWFGGTSRADAAPQTVATGSVVDDLDVRLPAALILGRVTRGGAPLAGATVRAYAEGDVWVGSYATTTRFDGTFTLSGAASGRYRIGIVRPGGQGISDWLGGPSRSTATWVEVGTAPVEGIDLDLPLD